MAGEEKRKVKIKTPQKFEPDSKVDMSRTAKMKKDDLKKVDLEIKNIDKKS